MPMTHAEELLIYSNSRNGLGIRILGAKRATNKSGIYIKQLLDDGLAQRDGRLQIGDQILGINDETAIGISREHAVNILRSAAATNQVRLRIRHFVPTLSSTEYQRFLYEEKSTDDDEDNQRQQNISQNRTNHHNTTNNEVRMRKSSRKHHHQHPPVPPQQQSYRHGSHNPSYENNRDEHQDGPKTVDISPDVLQSLLNSKFKSIDLVDLLKKTSPKYFSNDQKSELKLIEQLSEANPDGRITLKDFERQSSSLLGERVNLVATFFPSSNDSSKSAGDQLVRELRHDLASSHNTIEQLENKIVTCEKSQRLANEIELEYEDLLKFLSEQLNQLKMNETNQLKQLRTNDQLIQKLFNYLSSYVTKPTDEHLLGQLKFEYEQQQKYLSPGYQQNRNQMKISSTNKY